MVVWYIVALCSCGVNYINETVGNSKIRWNKHTGKDKKSDCVKHLNDNFDHFDRAPTNSLKHKTLETYYFKRHARNCLLT